MTRLRVGFGELQVPLLEASSVEMIFAGMADFLERIRVYYEGLLRH